MIRQTKIQHKQTIFVHAKSMKFMKMTYTMVFPNCFSHMHIPQVARVLTDCMSLGVLYLYSFPSMLLYLLAPFFLSHSSPSRQSLRHPTVQNVYIPRCVLPILHPVCSSCLLYFPRFHCRGLSHLCDVFMLPHSPHSVRFITVRVTQTSTCML